MNQHRIVIEYTVLSVLAVVTAARSEDTPTADVLARGKALYAQQCATCHGADGSGKGEAAFMLFPKPRNFIRPAFRLISNQDGVASAQDLFTSITRGMPGSSMPSWEILPEVDRWALVHFVRSLRWKPERGTPTPIDPGVEPAAKLDGVAHGRQLFMTACAACHGASGKGDGPQEQFDTDGYPDRPRDLTRGIFKGSRQGRDLYNRIAGGLPGSPMPASLESFSPADIWDIVHYVQSLSGEGADQRVRQALRSIPAKRVDKAPSEDPFDPSWNSVPLVYVALMPLWWRDERPDGMIVRAVHDGSTLFVQMSWEDPTNSSQRLEAAQFADGAALQFSNANPPPFFGMGHKGGPEVFIWQWKSDKQDDLAAGGPANRKDVNTVHPNMYVTTYGSEIRSPLAAEKMGVDFSGISDAKSQPATALDLRYITGIAAGNLVSKPGNTAVEGVTARGFGTLGKRPSADTSVKAKADWKSGVYSVVFSRSLKAEQAGGLSFEPGAAMFMAFASWDGAAGDRNGQKNVTIWHKFEIAK